MIFLKSPSEIELMRRANVIVAEILAELRQKIAPGVTTLELDRLSEELTYRKKARPAFKGYMVAGRVYPYSLCASVNEEIVHGMPSNRALKAGDIIGLDFGVVYEGLYGDAAITVGVGTVSAEAERLMQVTEQSLYWGIDEIQDGKRIGELSSAIQQVIEAAGFSV